MMYFPCYCTHCGAIFAMDNILVGGEGSVTKLVLEGNKTNCPNCGDNAQILDGTYSYAGGDLSFKDGPEFTKSAIIAIEKALKKLAEDAKAGVINPDDALNSGIELLPEPARAIIENLPRNNPLQILILAIFLIQAMLGTVDTGVNLWKNLTGNEIPVPANTVDIHDNVTNINILTPGYGTSESSPPRLNRHERRKAESLKRSENKANGRKNKRSEKEPSNK